MAPLALSPRCSSLVYRTRLRTMVRTAGIGATLTLAVGCARLRDAGHSAQWRTPGRMLVDAPARFIMAGDRTTASAPVHGCADRLVDQRYGVELALVRASDSHEAAWRGDYRASAPQRYDVAEGELLRVECATGLPLGVVGGAVIASDAGRLRR
ncbi:MAG: hypothetical protein MUF21_04720 [Gemmatimonadaceae bacterium]|jgi:hypothetical protein|nr:hypothetical protein [Gemmatimonadaceae bacterium]